MNGARRETGGSGGGILRKVSNVLKPTSQATFNNSSYSPAGCKKNVYMHRVCSTYYFIRYNKLKLKSSCNTLRVEEKQGFHK